MGVVKNQKKNKTKNEIKKTEEVNGKIKKDENKVKKKKKVSCLQCIKSHDDGGLEGKYRVAAPELMQDTFMSDSEDEGGEVECPIQQQQQYRYMASEAGTLQRSRPLAADHTVADGHLWPSNNDKKVATIERQPVDIGFLVSFVVDARGGAMKAKRRGGVRIIVPPAACAAPTRVTCRAATRRAPAAAPPPLMEGEALASRLLELQPQGAKFLAPVIIEVPIFTASCKEREIVVLRSDTGDTWQDHYLHNNDNPIIQEALARERQEYGPSGEALGESGERVTRVVTCDFPHYLAVVSRVRQEVHVIGPEGGTVSSAHIPQVQALFPPQALTKRIRVGLQAHGASPELARRVLPRHAAVSPVLTVEPRRRKFHRSITLTVPLPQQGAVHDKASTATLRLLCSIMGGQARAVWEDVTGSTPLTLTEDCASFTTTVSARFWLMNCQNVSDATKLATELYREMLLVPFEVRIVVLGKRLDALEGRLLVLYITDRYAYDTLLKQEHYTEIAHSTAVRFLDSKEVYLEFSGNLVPVTKSGSQPMFTFEAFKDNRVEFTVRVKHHEESPAGRVYFMNEPKVAKGEQSQTPACVLDVELPERIAPRAAKSQIDYLNLDQSGFDALKDELSFHWGDHNNSLGPVSLPAQGQQVNGHDKIITNGNVKYPTSDGEDKDTKPQVNGGSLHVDSNKTKATFDSDEDKTPMNTLEKGKKKPEGGSFFGGIADKVKNVFNYSDEKDEDVKESSPKPEPPQPQPKPRETKEKEKTPPKPAPRLITEDLLEKVDDIFKDIKHKPHIKDEDELDSHIYSTKLIVDEDSDRPSGLDNITEEVYQQYQNMQPVETPSCLKTSDPFQFYTGCCEGKYKKGQKHRHDETSNLVDRVEQINFTAHEKLDDLSDKVQNNVKDGLNKIGEEKEDIKQKTIEASEDLIEKTDALKKRLKDKGDEWKSSIDEKTKESESALNDQLNKLNEDVKDKKQTIQSSIEAEIENAKSSTKDTLSQLAETTNLAKSKLEHKVHEVDFAARERAEQLRLAGQDKIEDLETNIRNGANEKSKDLSDTLNNVQENLKNNVQDLKNELKTNVNSVKDKTKEKITDVNDAMNNVNDKVQKAAADTTKKAGEKKDQIETEVKKKKKEGKNFFTGLVHNIFGEKDKIENEIKEKASETQEYTEQLVKQASDKKDEINEKIAERRESAERLAKEQKDIVKEKVTEVKETADELIQKASSKKDNIEQNIKKKKVEISENIDHVVEATHDKKDKVQQALRNKKDEAEKACVDKTAEIKAAIDDKRHEIENTVEEKLDNLSHTKDEVQSEAKSQLERIWQEAVQTTEEIKKSGETLANAAANKKSDLQNNVSDKIKQLKDSGKEEIDSVQNAASDKLNDMQETSDKVKQTFDNLQESTLSTFDKVESAAKDKANAAKESLDEVQSSARDTYADMRDDVTSLENSAQDTLHSFQSSAGNTFDSLDESVKEYVSGASNTLQQVENNSKELFGDAKNTFEGFQISADNKLEDVKTSAKDNLENAGATLGETKEAVKEDLKGAEESVLNTVSSGADKLASGFEAVGNFALGAFDQGVKKDSSTKLLESEKAQSSPHKKSSGIPKLKRKK